MVAGQKEGSKFQHGLGVAVAAAAIALGQPVRTAHAGPVTVDGSLIPFADDALSVIKAQNAQIRLRQQRLHAQRLQAGQNAIRPIPTFSNDLNYQPARGPLVPLRTKSTALDTRGRLVQSGIGEVSAFVSGNLFCDLRETEGMGLHSDGVTIGADYRATAQFVGGLASTVSRRLATAGTATSAYLSFEPIESVFLDINASLGNYGARSGAAGFGLAGRTTARARALSMTLSRQQFMGPWVVSPYGRMDGASASIDNSAGLSMPARTLQAFSIGSLARTEWTSPYGTFVPQLSIELQRERLGLTHADTAASTTQGTLGFAMSTRMSRDMVAFAESRLMHRTGADSMHQAMLGLRMSF